MLGPADSSEMMPPLPILKVSTAHRRFLTAAPPPLAGTNYIPKGPYMSPHFSGNFWWTTGQHYLKLPKTLGDDRHVPEFHLMSAGGKMSAMRSTT